MDSVSPVILRNFDDTDSNCNISTMTTLTEKKVITVRAMVSAPVSRVWKLWTDPAHIVNWNHASDDWHTPRAENHFHTGGRFIYRMEARDGSAGFEFTGTYTRIETYRQIELSLDDGRNVWISFDANGNKTRISECFEAEHSNPVEMQRQGWQNILDNFKHYVEKSSRMVSLHFEIAINSKVEKVYKTMLDKEKYPDWTSAFNPDSHFQGSWEKGSTMLFMGTDENGNTGGMSSRIRENLPNKFISIEHISMIRDGKEVISGPEASEWTGALENYTFIGKRGRTLLSVDTDSTPKYKSYFEETWPKALNRLKVICETK
jgi:uncharacterized protein YndB with AHSA1/START domain